MKFTTVSLLLFYVFSLATSTEDETIVILRNGAARGTTHKSVEGEEYFAFLGIPFAEPPVGDLRFTAPVPKGPWSEEGILDATKDGAVCPQFDLLSKSIVGDEDCLFINVYTKQFSPEKKYPVMVWIYGGGFMVGHGSSWMYGPSRFIADDVVVVTFNYRTDSLGFLSTNDDASPGNYGLLDQVEALKWVKENIDVFGGDANQITIFGQSAGAASVFYHTVSPLSKGLFHRLIALSGSPICPWGFQKKPQVWAGKLGKELNCPSDHHELVECLRKLPAVNIVKVTIKLRKELMIPFPPVLDGKFLTVEPHKAFEEGLFNTKVPILLGKVENEGIGVYGALLNKLPKYSEDLLKQLIRQAINYERDVPSVIELIRQKYLQNYDLSNKLDFAVAASAFLHDATFEVCTYQTAEYLMKAGMKTRLYNFDFRANYSITNLLGIKEYMGVAHADDVWYLFDGKMLGGFMRNDRVKQMSKRFVRLFTNFAKFGDPTRDVEVKWPKSTPGNLLVYHIDEVSHVVRHIPEDEPRTEFWLKTINQKIRNAEEIKHKGEL